MCILNDCTFIPTSSVSKVCPCPGAINMDMTKTSMISENRFASQGQILFHFYWKVVNFYKWTNFLSCPYNYVKTLLKIFRTGILITFKLGIKGFNFYNVYTNYDTRLFFTNFTASSILCRMRWYGEKCKKKII